MKFKLFSTFVISMTSLVAYANVPTSTVMDVLNLPSDNRQEVIGKLSEDQYGKYLQVALEEKESMHIRWRALIAAAQIRGIDATVDLVKASQHKQWFIRNAALVALEKVNAEESYRIAKNLILDKALVVRSAAVDVLKKQQTSDVRVLLWKELNKDYNFKNQQSLWIRHKIVEALALNPSAIEKRMFAQLLTDRDNRVQLPAISGLKKLTGVSLGKGRMETSALIELWKEYVKKEKFLL
jgi:HEAT repeat protein